MGEPNTCTIREGTGESDEWYADWYKCTGKDCGQMVITESFNWCPVCGRKIKWLTREGKPRQ